MAPLDIAKIRGQIPALRKLVYLNTGGSGPLPRTVAEEIAFTLSVSEGLSAIAYGIDWSPRDEEIEATVSAMSTLANENRRR